MQRPLEPLIGCLGLLLTLGPELPWGLFFFRHPLVDGHVAGADDLPDVAEGGGLVG